METLDELRIEKATLRAELRTSERQCEELRWLIAEIEDKIEIMQAPAEERSWRPHRPIRSVTLRSG